MQRNLSEHFEVGWPLGGVMGSLIMKSKYEGGTELITSP